MKKLLFLAIAALVFSVAAGTASAQYQPMYITAAPAAVPHCSTVPGQVTVTSGYFVAGSTVTVSLASDPVVLGTAVANATGNISATYTLPSGTTVGQHTVFASGTRLGSGTTETVSAAITVVAGPSCVSSNSATQSTSATSTSGGSLPVTGSDNGIFVAAGAGLLIGGGLLVLATRRRNATR